LGDVLASRPATNIRFQPSGVIRLLSGETERRDEEKGSINEVWDPDNHYAEMGRMYG
jgi:hypothetical protein